MLINLCFNSTKVLKIIERYPEETILDITGVLYQKKIKNSLILAREIDKDGSIEKRALNNYVETIGRLSNHKINKKQSIRDIKVGKISLFWLTSLAEKHDSYHWGQVVFFFLQLIKEKKIFFDTAIIIILHNTGEKTKSSITKSILKYQPNYNITYINTNNYQKSLSSLIKIWIKEVLYFCIFKFKNMQKYNVDLLKYNSFFITPEIEAVNKNNSDFDVGWQKSIFSKNSEKSYNIPYLFSLKTLPEFSKNNGLKTYSDAQPTFSQFFSVFFSVLSCYFSLKKKIAVDFYYKSFFLDCEPIFFEFYDVLFKPSFFINYLFLKNFTSRINKGIFYYSDELYSTGRLISTAIKIKSNFLTTGIQHGLILENHTVYRITDSEQTGKNIIPLPDKFIIWDNLFKKRILLNSKIIETRLIINNNEKYNNFSNKIKAGKINVIKDKKNILWCTTLPEHFIFEAAVLKKINFNDYNLHIRLHPLMLIKPQFVKKTLKEIPFTISNESLINDFIFADIVITNPFSTIFYDAVIANIPVIRILNYSTFIDFRNEFKNKLFDVWNYSDLKQFLKQ